MKPEFVLPTHTYRVATDDYLPPDDRFLLGKLNLLTYYQAAAIVDVPRHVFNEEIRETIETLKLYGIPFLILRGCGTNSYPATVDDMLETRTIRNRSRTRILILRGDDSVEEQLILGAGNQLTWLHEQTVFQPFCRVLWVDAHQIEAMVVESIVYGRIPAEARLDELAEDIVGYLHRTLSEDGTGLEIHKLEAALFEVWARGAESRFGPPFEAKWFVDDRTLRCLALRDLHRSDIHPYLRFGGSGTPELSSELVIRLVDRARVMYSHDLEYAVMTLREHPVLRSLEDVDTITLSMMCER